MKKINYFLVFLFVIIASLEANAFNITVNVDDASRVTVYLARPSWHCRMETMRSM